MHAYSMRACLEYGYCIYLGWATMRKYGLSVFHPPGNFAFACSSETEGTIITFSPNFQFTGVATLCFAVSCNESMTRRI